LCDALASIEGVSLRVIGDGPLRAELESRYASDRIRFTGHLPWSEIKAILGTAAFMVLPSEWYENNPLTVIESFALGTPVLGADIGGIPELIVPNENGMIFQSGNNASFALPSRPLQAKRDWDYAKISRDAAVKFSAASFYRELHAALYAGTRG
jgi:glycosyltransferase involved in cell wall biosynthesis